MKNVIEIMNNSAIVVLLFALLIFALNFYVKRSTKNKVLTEKKYLKQRNIDCIIVLGAGVWEEKPSPMLRDRLDKAIFLYKKGVSPKMIMSGDHGKENYDEVNIMKDYAIKNGIPSQDIFMDHAGFSTYDSIYRAKKIFRAKKIVVVTQEYHLYRALYISKSLGVQAYGVMADPRKYNGQIYREIREILARAKDFIKCIFRPASTYMGKEIPVNGNGNITNDK